MVALSKDLLWLQPYLSHVRHFVSLKKLKSIRSRKHPEKKRARTDGSLHGPDSDGYFSIMIMTYEKKKDRLKSVVSPRRQEDIIHTICHELAHLYLYGRRGPVWTKHTEERFHAEAHVYKLMASLLKIRGYERG